MTSALQPRFLTAGGWQPVELHDGVSRFGPDYTLVSGTYRMHPATFARRECEGTARRVRVLPAIIDPAVDSLDGDEAWHLTGAERLAA